MRYTAGMVIVQKPNLPLIVALTGLAVAHFTAGWAYTVFHILGMAALAYWCYLEITEGVNLFRRILGWVVLVFDAWSVIQAVFY